MTLPCAASRRLVGAYYRERWKIAMSKTVQACEHSDEIPTDAVFHSELEAFQCGRGARGSSKAGGTHSNACANIDLKPRIETFAGLTPPFTFPGPPPRGFGSAHLRNRTVLEYDWAG